MVSRRSVRGPVVDPRRSHLLVTVRPERVVSICPNSTTDSVNWIWFGKICYPKVVATTKVGIG